MYICFVHVYALLSHYSIPILFHLFVISENRVLFPLIKLAMIGHKNFDSFSVILLLAFFISKVAKR